MNSMPPLSGQKVLITRARPQANELADRIRMLGGEAIVFPVIDLRPMTDPDGLNKLDHALTRLQHYDWLIFTSVNGVHYFFRRMREIGIGTEIPASCRIAAVGPKTAVALMKEGCKVHDLPRTYDAEGLLESLSVKLSPGERVLLATGDLARDYLPRHFRQLGIEVTKVDVYRNVPADEEAAWLIALFRQGEISIATFTSPSTVRHLIAIIRRYEPDPLKLLAPVRMVCIGPVTAQAVLDAGLRVDATALEATMEGLIHIFEKEGKSR